MLGALLEHCLSDALHLHLHIRPSLSPPRGRSTHERLAVVDRFNPPHDSLTLSDRHPYPSYSMIIWGYTPQPTNNT